MNELTTFAPDFSLLVDRDSGRIEEYGRFQQHLVLLEDRRRIARYAQAIALKEPRGVVVDVGAGTGILSMLALRHGFEHAFLVEPSRKIGAYARHLAGLNGVSDRITIVESTLESMPSAAIPEEIDLVVTETISSVIFGFGCWDAFPPLLERLTSPTGIIPLRGTLHAALCRRELATRGSLSGGLDLLGRLGISVDLFERTFRSGGNVYDKSTVETALKQGELLPAPIASFDFSRSGGRIVTDESPVPAPEAGSYVGLVLFWEILLAPGPESVLLSSADPGLTSWYPYYVPFIEPIELAAGEMPGIRMAMHRIDAPYTYAFQFMSGGRELSEILYW